MKSSRLDPGRIGRSTRGWLFVEQDNQAELGGGNLGGNIHAHLAGLHDVFPAGAGALYRKVLALHAGGDLGRGHGKMLEDQAGKRALDQFHDEARGADLGELGNVGDQVCFAGRR